MPLLLLLWSLAAWSADPPELLVMLEADPEWVEGLESGEVAVVIEGPEGPAWEVGEGTEPPRPRLRERRTRRPRRPRDSR